MAYYRTLRLTQRSGKFPSIFEDKSSVQRSFSDAGGVVERGRRASGGQVGDEETMWKIIISPAGAPLLLALVISASGFTAPPSSYEFRYRQQIQRAGSRPYLQHERTAAARQATPDDGSEGEATELASDSSVENQVTDASSITEAATPKVEEDEGSKGFSIILLPTLLFKFTIVLLIKVATDAVAYPALWLYRLARLTKRKILKGVRILFGLHDNEAKDIVVNGDSS